MATPELLGSTIGEVTLADAAAHVAEPSTIVEHTHKRLVGVLNLAIGASTGEGGAIRNQRRRCNQVLRAEPLYSRY